MTTCETIHQRLTAYLDGELTGDAGSVVRGHLRECASCRQIAADEAALRDGLRQLPPVDPPAALWAGVQARLAAAEVADAHTPRWRLGIARWARWLRPLPATRMQILAGGLAVAAAVVALSWRAQRIDEPAQSSPLATQSAPRRISQPDNAVAGSPAPSAPSADDVTADLAAEPARTTASYDQAVVELMKLASEARSSWSDEQRAAFDGKLVELRAQVSRAGSGQPEQRAQRQLIHYLQGALVRRDEVILASGGAR